jgi:WD40 repeat protein
LDVTNALRASKYAASRRLDGVEHNGIKAAIHRARMLYLGQTQRGVQCGGWSIRFLSGFSFLAVTLLFVGSGRAQVSQGPSGEPILRIEAGQHGAAINRIDTDAENRFAVTSSDDKTVRVWSLPDGKVLRILRLPIDINNTDVGKAYAVAISPNGDTVAVGGYTTGGGQSENIFLFDRTSGALKRRLADLPNVTTHLAYSSDGRRLAAALGGNNGIRVFDAANGYRLLPSDKNYGDDSYSAMFDRTGRLVTASLDGFIRLYSVNSYSAPIARYESKGRKPYAAAFSPDGARVAVGHRDTDVTILSGSNLTKLFNANTAGIRDGDLSTVGWSQDGRFLFAGGTYVNGDQLPVRRWSNAGRGAFVDLPAGSDSITDIRALKSGAMLFAYAKGLGLIRPDATAIELQSRGILDLASGRGPLRVSADGSAVQVDSWQPQHTYRFTLARRVVEIDPPPDGGLIAPITEASGLAVTGWEGSDAPAVNGAQIKLVVNDLSRSIAIAPDAQRFVLGTSFSLRLVDQNAQNVWRNVQSVPGTAWQVNVTGDGRLVVVAYNDGTIRWHRISDGKELLALFIHPDGQRWVAWTPQGYYDAALGADELIGWQVNHGFDQAPDFYPASRFRDRFYRPDVIYRVLRDLDVEAAVREANKAANLPDTRAAPVSALLTPVIEINDPKTPAAVDRTDVQIGYSVRLPSPDDWLRVEALVDGVKVTADDRRLVDTGALRAGILHLTIPRRNATVSAVAYNGNGASEPAKVQVTWRGAGTDPKLTLYVLAIGISDYRDKNVKLRFAAKDADDFVAWAKAQESGLYEKVVTHPPRGSLRDSEATKDAVLDELDWIKRAVTNTDHVAMIFLAGHGITTPDRHYRFLPHDYDPNRVERTTISDSELQDYLTKIGGKKIFFFDTCYSGSVLAGRATSTQADVDKFANMLKTAENGVVVFTSSTGNELSQEKDEWENGAFTKALVEGLRGAAARPQVPVVMISDLQGYVSQRVRELTNGNQKPMMAMPTTVEDYPISRRLQ